MLQWCWSPLQSFCYSEIFVISHFSWCVFHFVFQFRFYRGFAKTRAQNTRSWHTNCQQNKVALFGLSEGDKRSLSWHLLLFEGLIFSLSILSSLQWHLMVSMHLYTLQGEQLKTQISLRRAAEINSSEVLHCSVRYLTSSVMLLLAHCVFHLQYILLH